MCNVCLVRIYSTIIDTHYNIGIMYVKYCTYIYIIITYYIATLFSFIVREGSTIFSKPVNPNGRK